MLVSDILNYFPEEILKIFNYKKDEKDASKTKNI